jgi:predicted ATPase
MRVKRLQLKNWRNFSEVDIALQSRAFFVGPNAAGKSNLLDALRFLRDVAAATGGGLQEAVARRGGVKALRCLAARRDTDISLEVHIGGDDGPEWRYRLAFNAAAKDPRPFVTSETVVQVDGDSAETLLDRPDEKERNDPELLTETHLEQISANRAFREVAEFLRSIRYLHLVPQIVRDPGRAGDGEEDSYGGRFLSQIAAKPKKTREARLKRMNEALKLAVPQLGELQLETDASGVPHLKAKYAHWRPQGAWQREDQFSDGTLRLLGLMWALMEGGGPLLLEEPELSLQSAIVARLAPVLWRATRRGARQSLVTTHSQELLNDPGIGLDEVFTLEPGPDGTKVQSIGADPQISAMMENGLSIADAIQSVGRPDDIDQLPLFAGKWS